jgi:hypothetical protein
MLLSTISSLLHADYLFKRDVLVHLLLLLFLLLLYYNITNLIFNLCNYNPLTLRQI